MIRLIKISKGQIRSLVELSYENDQELFDHYHLAKMPFEQCVQSTMNLIDEVAKTKDLIYYKVLFNKQPIGYVIIYANILYSYAIALRFRRKDILVAWWAEIKKLLGSFFATGIYQNNTRAIEFLEKQGMIVSERRGDIVTLLSN